MRLFNCDSSVNCTFVKRYYKIILMIFISMFIAFSSNLISICGLYIDRNNKQMQYNIQEYQEVDYEQLCRISNCLAVVDSSRVMYKADKNRFGYNILKKAYSGVIPNRIFNTPYFYTTNPEMHVYTYVAKAGAYFAIDLTEFALTLKGSFLNNFMLVFTLAVLFLRYTFIKSEHEHMLQVMTAEAILSAKNSARFSEDAHHQLNTPADVIGNKSEKIKKICDNALQINYIQKPFYDSIMKELEYIDSNQDQICNIIYEMRGKKAIRYSNGNKNVYEITLSTVSCLCAINRSSFVYDVDKEFNNYKVRHDTKITFRNADWQGILDHHLKNSIEAKATSIFIRAFHYNQFTEMLTIHIIDNGNGIPPHIKHSDIFKPNFSTKDSSSVIRGNGMYINKFIAESGGGKIEIVDSNSNGTIIAVTIPAEKVANETYD